MTPFTLVCPVTGQQYTPDASEYVRYSDATLVWCSACLAHGERKLHLVTESWTRLEHDEPATVGAGPVESEALK